MTWMMMAMKPHQFCREFSELSFFHVY